MIINKLTNKQSIDLRKKNMKYYKLYDESHSELVKTFIYTSNRTIKEYFNSEFDDNLWTALAFYLCLRVLLEWKNLDS